MEELRVDAYGFEHAPVVHGDADEEQWADLVTQGFFRERSGRSSSDVWKLALGGVPPSQRRRVWCDLLDIGVFSAEFDRCCKLLPDEEVIEQIDKDCDRTFPENLVCRTQPYLRSLRRVLLAYATHNRAVAYCQGLNFVAGAVLLVMLGPVQNSNDVSWIERELPRAEHAAFAALVAVVDCVPDYFIEGLIGARTDVALLRELLQRELPRVATVLGPQDVLLVASKWLLSLFFDSVTFEAALAIIDNMLICHVFHIPLGGRVGNNRSEHGGAENGDIVPVLVAVGLAMFAENAERILQFKRQHSEHVPLDSKLFVCDDVAVLLRRAAALTGVVLQPPSAPVAQIRAECLKAVEHEHQQTTMRRQMRRDVLPLHVAGKRSGSPGSGASWRPALGRRVLVATAVALMLLGLWHFVKPYSSGTIT